MYFAYGSNMNLDQMAYRCPAAEAVCTAKLEGYELFFAGRPGNGVASIRPKQGGTVVGVVIAGLAAQGTTEISCIHHIERGYEDIVRKLSGVGADIRVVITPDADKAQADVG